MTLTKDEINFLYHESLLRLAQLQRAYAYCPHCSHQDCGGCEHLIFKRAEALRLLPQGFKFKLFPPEMWDKVIQCCSCGSERHTIEWLRKEWHPAAYEHAKVGTTKLPQPVKDRVRETFSRQPNGFLAKLP